MLANFAFLIRMRGVPMWSVCENTLPLHPLDLCPMPTPPQKKESKKLPRLKWSQSLEPQTQQYNHIQKIGDPGLTVQS